VPGGAVFDGNRRLPTPGFPGSRPGKQRERTNSTKLSNALTSHGFCSVAHEIKMDKAKPKGPGSAALDSGNKSRNDRLGFWQCRALTQPRVTPGFIPGVQQRTLHSH